MSYTNTPALTDERRGELESLIEETRRRLTPASPEEISKQIAKLAMGVRHGPGEPQDRKAFVAILLEHTMGYPIDIIRDACYEWTHGHTFFPSVAEFCGLCEPKYQARRSALVRMQQALVASERKRAEQEAEEARKREFRDPAKRAALEAKLKAARENLIEARARHVARRANHVALPDDERERLLQKLGSRQASAG